MKKGIKNYSVRLISAAVFSILIAGIFQTSERVAAQTNPATDLREGKAIEYLRQSGGYNSLSEAIKNAQIAENPSASDLLFVQRQKLTANDGVSGDQFGVSVAISGDTAVVGANRYQSFRGAAYVFVRSGSGWAQQAKLTANDGATGDNFGRKVAISGDTIIVGAPLDDISSNAEQGSAYIFVRSGTSWTAQDKLTANDGAASDNFGSSVGISGETVIIGADADDIGANQDQGSSYIYVRSGGAWTLQQKLTPSPGMTGLLFGSSVAIAGSTIIVGANGEDVGGQDFRGAAYVFVRNGSVWSQQTKLTSSDGAAGDQFGASVDLALTLGGAIAVVGAIGDSIAGNPAQGSAYVFNRSQIGSWSQTQKLTAADGDAQDTFGRSVSISPTTGSTIIVGAFLPGSSISKGSAYIYRRVDSVWTQQQKLTAYDFDYGDYFGLSVAITNDTAIVGAAFHNINGNIHQGAAYVFNLGGASPFDFDGDGKSDISIFRPSVGQWWYYRSSDGGNYAATFGLSNDKLVPGDFTGDGKIDIAIFRPSTGEWFILRSEDGSYYSFPFGTSGDLPAVGDFDDDGKADQAVFRPSDTNWYIRRSSDGGFTITQFGASGDVPAVADYDADGKSDIAIWRASAGQWWINRSAAGTIAYTFGNSADKPVQGDYTGDGKADVAIWRPSTGEWFILRSEDASYYSFPFGANGDIPAPGDFDGDGKYDATVFRPSGSTWYIQRSTAGTLIQGFGVSGDKPVPNAFVP